MTCGKNTSQGGWMFTRAVCRYSKGFVPIRGFYLVNRRGKRKWMHRRQGSKDAREDGKSKREKRLDAKFATSKGRIPMSRKQRDGLSMG